jgi:Fe-S cluster assembly iron-binding protein IscA
MVLDEPKASDEVFEVNEFTMVVDKNLHETTKDVTVDYVVQGARSGFQVTSEVPVGGNSACGSSCSC